MIIKQPSLCAVALMASCPVFTGMVATGHLTSNVVHPGTATEALLGADTSNGDPVSSALNILPGIKPDVIKSQAPAKSVYQLYLKAVMNMKLDMNRENTERALRVYG